MAPLFLTLAVIGMTYGAIVAAVQKDLKRLVAYSSVAHLGFIILGLFDRLNIAMPSIPLIDCLRCAKSDAIAQHKAFKHRSPLFA